MSENVEVVLSALIDASTGIDQVIDDMSTLGTADVTDLAADTGRDYGHEPLALAVRAFADAWSHGLHRLMRDATGLSESLHESAQTYAETEHINIDLFQQGR
ncbi:MULTISPECIES: type VII secretion target [unclassified Saccharopolyspora]|uniref:type VII secretion target n=1 Tax=unclassified Saccharopolyspora TaxID=2646250 RepID=UPI001CD2BC2B|nr:MULTISPECIES: type VII secretion target [unclassified Saccharopolyspora]MCA1194515.1 ESX-1 secretion-associated protein [Saccharopolyspora sp. 6V]MCA1229401.1 ESX-1 secretion-associated protein [Saccharopolyspora sp. 6M]